MKFQLLILVLTSTLLVHATTVLLSTTSAYYCPTAGSYYQNLTGTPNCYQTLGPILRANYASGCNNIGSNTLNVVNSAMALEVISVLQYFKYYGTWVS